MVNRDLRTAPSYDLLPGLQLHWYGPGDERLWIDVHEQADQYSNITPQLFIDQFADDRLDLGERQCYLLDSAGTPIATATAWGQRKGRFDGYGRLHWVAVVPGHRDRGIGRIVVSIACQRLVELGYRRAFLVTSTLRPAAIHLYEKFGFTIEERKG